MIAKKTHKVVAFTIPYNVAVIGVLVLGCAVAIATVLPVLFSTYLTAGSFVVAVASLGVVARARRIVRTFQYEAKEKISDIGNLPTEDPAQLSEGGDSAGSIARLPIRRNA